MISVTTHKKRADRLAILLVCLAALALLQVFAAPVSQAAASEQKRFASPDEAVEQLVKAIREHDTGEMIVILGPGSSELVSSGDDAADRVGREKFLRAYDLMHSLRRESADRVLLGIGSDSWPMPVPIIKKGSTWVFDAMEGKQEILNRRIGRNELHVMDVLQAYVAAQHEYACGNYSGSGTVEFAQRLISSEGKRDGLYWEAGEEGEQSPLGPLVAQAAEEGYTNSHLSPFHGYYFKILKGQGKHAVGGAYSYMVKGKMILGFAIVAYPAEYGNSGIMTFVINQTGVMYQKDLGKNTRRSAEQMELFNPDRSWEKVTEAAEEE